MPDVGIDSGVSLHYDEIGSGRPVVFVHGWAMSGRVWRFQHSLAQSFRLVLLDQRGHGHSSAGSGYGLADFSGDLVSFVEQLDLRDVVLVGWSMGVQVALEAFPKLRDRLAGVVLVGGTPRFTSCDGYPHGKPPVEVKGLGLRLRRDYQKTMGDFFRGMFAEAEMDAAQYQRIVHEIVMGGKSPDHEAAQLALQILSSADLREGLCGIDRPVLLVHGAEDGICPVGASQYMAERLPQAELKVMEGCGHAPFMTRPQEFNRVLQDFLARLG
ncbi:O-methylpimelyl-ACP methylesterase [Geomonas silvestris]|uniref:O-methylpimelyl-ACP methylesterase n=1 Tax=Geomonas silvestris TaxID=2740184 RepID=A0A6V8MPE9_9BACT|nr:alpha/beta fold hydrolase [Geomonas silvestris]GFO61583.1 O-methylpimelyl-ACP methylesterase [Geomonas silvestris]